MELKPKHTRKTVLLVLLAVVVAGGAGAGAYFYRDKLARDAEAKTSVQVHQLETKIADLNKQLASKDTSSSTGATVTACSIVQPNASGLDNIKASITSGNTAVLEGYMAPTVSVVYAASDGLGNRTPTQAVGDITSFIKDTKTWNFEVPASLLSSYGQGSYGTYFPGTAVVGKSNTGKVLSFNFDCDSKIATVFMAAIESDLQ